ncbi:MAG: iron-containing alcohol dehydrogenase [Clostridia bacterium]|nr:iron-containing alcohol dehydrogenase [Clostridia bacterium]
MDMNFFMPTKIVSGVGSVKSNAELFNLGDSCIIVTGASSAIKSGALDDVIEVLENLNIEYVVFDRIRENPLMSTCFDGGQIAAAQKADFVIGIGGGSPMDAAKAVAAYAANLNISPDGLFDSEKLKLSLPIIEIPTTSGTGSEVNPYSILSLDGKDLKKTFNSIYSYPKYAFLDPKYTYDLPKSVTLSTALDAFCHCIESYNSPKFTVISEQCALFGAKKIWRALDEIEKDAPVSEKTRERLMNAACVGGMAINTTGTGFPHPMGYNLTFYANIPHGRACGAFIGKYIENAMTADESAKRITKFALRIGATPEEIAYKIPKLANVDVRLDGETVEMFCEKISGARNFENSINPLPRNRIKEIYEELFLR